MCFFFVRPAAGSKLIRVFFCPSSGVCMCAWVKKKTTLNLWLCAFVKILFGFNPKRVWTYAYLLITKMCVISASHMHNHSCDLWYKGISRTHTFRYMHGCLKKNQWKRFFTSAFCCCCFSAYIISCGWRNFNFKWKVKPANKSILNKP